VLTLTSCPSRLKTERGKIEDHWSRGNRVSGTVCRSAGTSFIYWVHGNETHRSSTATSCLCYELTYVPVPSSCISHYTNVYWCQLSLREALSATWLKTEGAEGELNSRQKRDSLERLRPHQPQDFFPRPQCAELCASLWDKAVTADKNIDTAINRLCCEILYGSRNWLFTERSWTLQPSESVVYVTRYRLLH
jgi:hypothetical protein